MKNTLKRNNDFRRLYARGKCAVAGTVVVYAMKNRFGQSRIGLTTGKSVGNAVKRNRARRLIRESCRQLREQTKPGFDLVIVARTRIITAKCQRVTHDLETALRKLDLLVK